MRTLQWLSTHMENSSPSLYQFVSYWIIMHYVWSSHVGIKLNRYCINHPGQEQFPSTSAWACCVRSEPFGQTSNKAWNATGRAEWHVYKFHHFITAHEAYWRRKISDRGGCLPLEPGQFAHDRRWHGEYQRSSCKSEKMYWWQYLVLSKRHIAGSQSSR